MDHQTLVENNRKYTFTTWRAQADWQPITMDHGEGVYFWDAKGKKYIDFSSQLFNVNIGHGHPKVIKAIQDQAAKLSYAFPAIATEPRALLGQKLTEIAPEGLTKSFFTLGGSDAIENALKIARLYSGKQKILARYRAYHGATFGAMIAGGDPRRLANEPGIPWIVHFHDPYKYRSQFYHNRSQEDGEQALIAQIEETIQYEGPDNIAAILLEGYSGTSGIIQGGEIFWRGISNLCSQYGIILIIDEVLSGFGRTGKWFGVDHYPWVNPDILVMAKGLTSGYAPLGAVMVSEEIASYFDTNPLVAGLTYSAHPLCAAAGIAAIEVYQDENLIENSRDMGKVLYKELVGLSEEYECVGDIRGTGLHFVIELVKDRKTRQPMSGYNLPLSEPMSKLSATLRANGLSTFVKWNWIFCCPPLVINEEEIEEGIEIIDTALSIAQEYYEG
jgi:taurine--2-oxoglutarate transaminase